MRGATPFTPSAMSVPKGLATPDTVLDAVKAAFDSLIASGWNLDGYTFQLLRPVPAVAASAAPAPEREEAPSGLVCSHCGQALPATGGCKPCPECGTMSGGCG